jgi:hypothetical protein
VAEVRAALLLLLAGCPTMAGDVTEVYDRGADRLVLCSNAGFVLVQGGVATEGVYAPTNRGAEQGTREDTSEVVFTMEFAGDENGTAPELPGTWVHATSAATLEQADAPCAHLEQESWWPN